MSKLRVAMIAPPWLALPIKGYGGIELVLEALVHELTAAGVEVEVFGNGARTLKGVKTHALYTKEQYPDIHRPMYESMPIISAHMQFALTKIKEDGGFDIVHDHNSFFGPELFVWATQDKALPPVVYTHHGPPYTTESMLEQGLPSNRPYWEQLARHLGRLYFVGISNALMKPMSTELHTHVLPTVYNAVELDHFPFVKTKGKYFITLARFSRDKGQHIAAKLCAQKGYRLRMAGTVAGISSNRKLLFELANPLSSYRNTADFRYYSDKILPYTLRFRRITYSGNLSGMSKMKFVAHARALLFPIDWEEPFGMAVIEALACGTPVVAMNRGAMPEIIEHGVNGFLANDEKEFAEYMERVGEIDPVACRRSVEEKFSARTMAEAYIERYKEAIRLNGKSVTAKR